MTRDNPSTFKSLRKRARLTQAEIADAFGITVGDIRNIEDGILPTLPLYLYAISGLHFERAQVEPKCITAKLLKSAHTILKNAGYKVVQSQSEQK